MKIAYVYVTPDIRGGTERFIIETEKRFRDMGCQVKLFCNRFNTETAFPEFATIDKLIVPHRLDLFGKFRSYFTMKAIREAALKAYEWKPDIIMLGAGFLWSKYILKNVSTPAVSRVHTLTKNVGRLNSAYKRLIGITKIERESLLFKPIICNSEYTRSVILGWEPKAKTTVVYSGADVNYFTPTWEDEGYIYLNGRFQRYKNQLLAIRALKNTDYKLILSGYARMDSPDDKSYYDKILREVDGAKNIQIEYDPPREKIRRLYQAASIALVTSIDDFFPLVSVEAMACGKPVAALNSGGVPEIVSKAGVLFENSEEDLRRKVDYLMGDKDLRTRLGRRARAVAEQFNWDNTTRNLHSIFKDEIERQANCS